MKFRTKWVRTAVMLMLFAVCGYEVNLDWFIEVITDGVSQISGVLAGKPIKIPAKKVARFS